MGCCFGSSLTEARGTDPLLDAPQQLELPPDYEQLVGSASIEIAKASGCFVEVLPATDSTPEGGSRLAL